MSYLELLGRELRAVGINGALRRRIVAEIRDHLECEPAAELGSPVELAAGFADELGTQRARHAVIVGFSALVAAGILFAVAFIAGVSGFPHRHPHAALIGFLGAALAGIGAQVAFVAGVLAAVRVVRRRRAPVLARIEAVILVRRAGVALAAAAAAMAGVALLALEYDHGLSRSSLRLALATAAIGAAALLLAAPSIVSAARIRPVAGGSAGDLTDDLGALVPPALRHRPWMLALIVAGGIAMVITLAGVLQSDGYDGAARGIADALACLGAYALLGRYLGLRSAASPH